MDEETTFSLFPGLVYLAPSGSGKSRGAAFGRWVDGDPIIHATGGWPKEPMWWKDPALAAHYHHRHATILADYATANSVVVMFNGDWPSSVPPSPGGIILPTDEYLAATLPTHHRSKREGLDKVLADREPNRRGLRAIAAARGLPILEGPAADSFMRYPF